MTNDLWFGYITGLGRNIRAQIDQDIANLLAAEEKRTTRETMTRETMNVPAIRNNIGFANDDLAKIEVFAKEARARLLAARNELLAGDKTREELEKLRKDHEEAMQTIDECWKALPKSFGDSSVELDSNGRTKTSVQQQIKKLAEAFTAQQSDAADAIEIVNALEDFVLNSFDDLQAQKDALVARVAELEEVCKNENVIHNGVQSMWAEVGAYVQEKKWGLVGDYYPKVVLKQLKRIPGLEEAIESDQAFIKALQADLATCDDLALSKREQSVRSYWQGLVNESDRITAALRKTIADLHVKDLERLREIDGLVAEANKYKAETARAEGRVKTLEAALALAEGDLKRYTVNKSKYEHGAHLDPKRSYRIAGLLTSNAHAKVGDVFSNCSGSRIPYRHGDYHDMPWYDYNGRYVRVVEV